MPFNKDKLTGPYQSIAGPRSWRYADTGSLIADIQEVAGFFTNGHQLGMRKGDIVFITEGDTGLYSDTGDETGRRQYMATVVKQQDTGATQVTVGLAVLVGDTS